MSDAVEAGEQAAVLTEMRGNVLVVTLNRPQARNAIDESVSVGLGDALERAENDAQVRVVVLTGAGDKAFCAGADLKAIAAGRNIMHPDHPEWGFAGYVQHFISKPTIAAVNATALGGGTELALASDLVVATETARFGLPEVKRGLVAAAGGMFRLVDHLPRKVALQMLFTGEPISAADAQRWGLINEVVADGSVLDAALALAERVAGNAPLAVWATKRVAYGVGEDLVVTREQDDWTNSDREMVSVFGSQDAMEGTAAFAEKREPEWKAR